jgi:hypothetical protein
VRRQAAGTQILAAGTMQSTQRLPVRSSKGSVFVDEIKDKQIQELLKVKMMWSSVKDEIARDASLRSTDVCR